VALHSAAHPGRVKQDAENEADAATDATSDATSDDAAPAATEKDAEA
jgi:hypothetical protein